MDGALLRNAGERILIKVATVAEKLPSAFKNRYPDVDWQGINRMRNGRSGLSMKPERARCLRVGSVVWRMLRGPLAPGRIPRQRLSSGGRTCW